MTAPEAQTIKLKLIGDSGVGKSSIILRYCDNEFDPTMPPTIGVDYKHKNVIINTVPIKMSIWDTAGQEKFRTVTSTYYKGAHGICFVFDVSRKDTFENISKWVLEADSYINSKVVVKLLIANKIDLQTERVVSKTESENLAREYGMLYCECSAKTTEGISKAFELLASNILEANGIVTKPMNNKTLSSINKPEEKQSCCR